MPGTFVQGASNASNANTVSISPTAGNLLALVSQTSSGGGSPTFVSIQTNGGANFAVANAATQDSNALWHGCAYLKNCPSGVTTITVTYNGGTPGTCRLAVVEYSGLDTASPLVCTPSLNFQTAPGTGTDAVTTSSTAITAQPTMVLGIHYSDSQDNIVAGTGESNDFLSADNMRYASKRVTSVASFVSTATFVSIGSGFAASHFLAFQEPASVGPILMGQACL